MNLAIAIPIYNQPILLKDCLSSLRNQILFQSDIFLFDDASNQEYQSIISSFSDLKINYKKNPYNLGAMRNMHHSFNEVRQNIFPPTLNTNVSSSNGKCSVTAFLERQNSYNCWMFIFSQIF